MKASRTEEIELASLHLEVKGYVSPTWDIGAEPDAESWYTEWVESTFEPFTSELLFLDRIRIEPEFRGHGYGLYAAQLMINGFASNGLVACVPDPYELQKDVPPWHSGDDGRHSRDKAIPGWAPPKLNCAPTCRCSGFSNFPSRMCAQRLRFARLSVEVASPLAASLPSGRLDRIHWRGGRGGGACAALKGFREWGLRNAAIHLRT